MQRPVEVPVNSFEMVTASPVEVNHVLMQQQLALLLHAEQCRRLENKGIASNCMINHCCAMRQVLSHIEKCLCDEGCNFAHCRSSKLILRHFHLCNRKLCEVCNAVQKPLVKLESHPDTSHNYTDYHNGPFCSVSSASTKTDLSMVNGLKSSNSPICETMTTTCSSSLAVNGDTNRTNRNNFHLSDQQREVAMRKFVDVSLSIFPAGNSTAYSDPRMSKFLDHVKRMEKDIYMKSKSAKEYYAALTTCYKSIHSELNEQRRLRSARSAEVSNESTEALPPKLDNSESGALAVFTSSRLPDTREQNEASDAPAAAPKPEDSGPANMPPVQGPALSNGRLTEDVTVMEPVGEQGSKEFHTSPSDSKNTITKCTQPEEATDLHLALTTIKPEVAVDSLEAKSDESTTAFSSQSVRESSCRVIWYPNELLRHFMPVVEKISKEKDAEPFLQPVDWESLEIYDYPQIVSHPMDLSTIRKKLENREYKEPWDVVDDFWLMFNNAWLYNKKTSKVYKTCTKLAEIFETAIDPVMQQLGFCCGREYYYQPPPLTCLTPKFCTIQKDAVYYVYKNEDHTPGLLEQKYTICERCYNEATEEIRLDSESSTIVTVQKSLLEKCKNDRKEKEPFVFCKKCGRKWHRVCAIFMDEIWPEGFICDRCIKDHGLRRSENRFTARKLSTCKLSNFLEKRVNDFLKKKGVNTGDVIIRVLAAADKTVEVKPGMKAKCCETGEMPESFPYRVKAIFAFQDIDGQEVCFFGLHVQEYGSECPYPNTRRVYLAYLDSVYFFRPKQYRTDIYHELLVGYIHYAKLLGFTMAHIWACPPSEGDDYIFHMHPPDQKIPKPKRLQEWYQKMLKKALLEGVVVDYKDICQDACESRLVSPTELAYFEGDFWPNTLEELFKEMDEEDARRKREQEALARDDADDEETKESVQTRDNDNSNPGKKKAKKRKLKRNASLPLTGKRKRLSGASSADLANEVARRVYEIMEKHKENFFVIRLHPQNIVSSLPQIKDPDPLINSDLMECRGAFLERAREKHLEFSSIRRANYSTLVMLYELHNENRQPLMYTCNVCSAQLETPWHCKVCVEYDLCPRCYETEKHPHPMIQVGLSLDDGSTKGPDVESDAAAIQESGRDKLSRLVKALGHGCSCRDANCRVFACKTMKSNVQHFRVHAAAARNQCQICRSLSFLCYYHSKTCHDLKCPVPLCPKLKAKMKQQQKQQRLEQTQMLRRRMATMQRYNSMTPSHQPTPPALPPSASSEYVSSPVSTSITTSMQLSPYVSSTVSTTCTSFTTMVSPLSRTPISLPSPQQTPFFQLSGSSGPIQHPKSVGTNAAVLSSPSLTSPQHIGSGPHSLSSPYSSGAAQQHPLTYTDTSTDGMKVDGSSNPTTYAYQSLSRSQSVVATAGSMTCQPTAHLTARPHHLERSQSAVFCSSPSPQNPLPANHTQLTRQSPSSSHHNNAPSSPRYQQFYSTAPDPVSYVQQSNCAPTPRAGESQHSPYAHCKQQQLLSQRHPPQLGPLGNVIDSTNSAVLSQSQFPGNTNLSGSGWRPSAPNIGTSSTQSMYTTTGPLPPTTHSRGSSSPCTPNVTVARTVSGSLPSAPHGCVTPPLNTVNVAAEDVNIVKQAYSEVRQRGAPLSDVSFFLYFWFHVFFVTSAKIRRRLHSGLVSSILF
ncbi:E1A/CREB-binding protein [Paragonimus westermani]|uniref:histone acetyltransferase n=1 Tax=Paragonimus westermani TaxID=34504 RepID=A0A5J4NAB4_9TREM|nr:E1A/CREB-binding protein [Paragonimus westermani]